MFSATKSILRKLKGTSFVKSGHLPIFFIELISIFIAVTLAFALNKWNENKNNSNLETKILKEIYRGLEADSKDMKDNKNGHERGLEYLKQISPILRNDTTISMSIYLEYNSIFRTFLSIQNNSGFESLKSVGFDKITNDTLLSQLVKLYEIDYQMIEKLEEQYKENQINELYFETVNDLLMPYAEIKNDTITFKNTHTMEISKKNKMRIYLYKIVIARQFNIFTYSDVVTKIEKVKKSVQNELMLRGVDVASL
jgi:hypothetical protein